MNHPDRLMPDPDIPQTHENQHAKSTEIVAEDPNFCERQEIKKCE
jgi:hypothetical protein